MFSSFGKKDQILVISQYDIDQAMLHLNSFPHTLTKDMPDVWGQRQFLQWLIESLPKRVKCGDHFGVATGIYGHVVPVGFERIKASKHERLQVVLSIRKPNTGLDKLVKINKYFNSGKFK